jgi:hypothetical protein
MDADIQRREAQMEITRKRPQFNITHHAKLQLLPGGVCLE